MDEYQRLALETQVANANPHGLVQLMLDGAAARIAAARGALDAGETALKGELIGKAIGLVEGLRVSLNFERGGDLAANLSALYEYLGRRLLEANLHSDGAALDEVADLLRELQAGWREVGHLVTAEGRAAAHSAA
jgi:flagellar protein FliS